MATTINELLGIVVLQHNESDDKSRAFATDQLIGKTVALYFSAYSYQTCRDLRSKLAESFKNADKEIKDKLDIVFISHDITQAGFSDSFKEMPWKALPFSYRIRSRKLDEKFHAQDIPALIVLSPSCEIITSDGIAEAFAASDEALRQWSQGKRLFWSREPREGEHVWENTLCTDCYMNPVIGSCYTCTTGECNISLCETCLAKNTHEHSLVECLVPKRHYSLDQLFKSVPHLLNPNDDEKIETKTLWKDGVKSVGVYFSSNEFPYYCDFTLKLAELYKEVQTSSDSLSMVYVSCDKDEESFNEQRSQMSWPAVPFNARGLLFSYFQLSTIPALFIFSADGKILSRRGYEDISRIGVEALKTWAQGDKLARPSEEEYVWPDFTCDGCRISPIIGQRYCCSICGNYDLCSACEKKGHEHPLQLTPQPTDEYDD